MTEFINNSGQGPSAVVPQEIAGKFNWGAFLLSWIWGIGNKSYITLLMFLAGFLTIIPLVGALVPIGFAIWCGMKGNEWAWQNKNFESIEQFHENQKKWTVAGVVIFVIMTGISALLSFVGFMAMLGAQG